MAIHNGIQYFNRIGQLEGCDSSYSRWWHQLLTDEAICSRLLFLVDDFLSTRNFAVYRQSCRWQVVENPLSTTKSDRWLHKIRVCGCVSKQSSVTKSRRWEKVINEKRLSTTSVSCVCSLKGIRPAETLSNFCHSRWENLNVIGKNSWKCFLQKSRKITENSQCLPWNFWKTFRMTEKHRG